MLSPKRRGRSASAIQMGTGIRITSVKQDVGSGDEIEERAPWSLLALCTDRWREGKGTYKAFSSITAQLHNVVGDW
jgi:hypothetical protein